MNNELKEKQLKVVEDFKNDVRYWKAKSNGRNKTIFELTPSELIFRLKKVGIQPDKNTKYIGDEIINRYTKQINSISTSKEFKELSISRLKSVIYRMEDCDFDIASIKVVINDEIEQLEELDLIEKAKKHRQTLFDFTNEYNAFVTNYITSPQNEINK